MTIRRMALQQTISNLTVGSLITADATGFLMSTGLLAYAYIQNVSATDRVLGRQSAGAGVIEEIVCTAAGRALLDDADAAAQRTTLGLGTIATQAANSVSITGGAISGITDISVADGGTGSSTAAAARLAIGVVDAYDRMPAAMLPTKLLSSFWHASWDERTVVQGTWSQAASASETDFDDSLTSVAGFLYNSTSANNDELHFGNLTLNSGTYKINISFIKDSTCAIIEILHGTTSLGTVDAYAAGAAYNNKIVFTYSPTTRVTGNIRIKATGRNGSSAGYLTPASKIEIIRTG